MKIKKCDIKIVNYILFSGGVWGAGGGVAMGVRYRECEWVHYAVILYDM